MATLLAGITGSLPHLPFGGGTIGETRISAPTLGRDGLDRPSA
jgi:hypothetical protein